MQVHVRGIEFKKSNLWTISIGVIKVTLFFRLLAPISKKESESLEDFAKRVQVTMATELNIKATTHTTVDKVEYTKRKFFLQKGESLRHLCGNAVMMLTNFTIIAGWLIAKQ